MKHKQLCPRCKSNQRFGVQRKPVNSAKVELYIQCTICRWKKTLVVEYEDRLKLRRDIERLKVRALGDPQLKKVLQKRIKRLNDEQRKPLDTGKSDSKTD